MGGSPGFDTYTENDVVGDRLQNITADSVDIVALRRADIPVNLGKAIGSSIGEITIADPVRFKLGMSSVTGPSATLYTFILSNVANVDGNYYNAAGADKEAITFLALTSGSFVKRVQIFHWKTDGTFIVDTFNVDFVTTDLWIEIIRNAAKTQTTVNVYDADTFDVADLLDTLIVSGTPTTEFVHHYGAAGAGTVGGNEISGEISEYVVPWVVPAGGQEVLVGGGLGDDETYMGGMQL